MKEDEKKNVKKLIKKIQLNDGDFIDLTIEGDSTEIKDIDLVKSIGSTTSSSIITSKRSGRKRKARNAQDIKKDISVLLKLIKNGNKEAYALFEHYHYVILAKRAIEKQINSYLKKHSKGASNER
jgi:hypothetical protein